MKFARLFVQYAFRAFLADLEIVRGVENRSLGRLDALRNWFILASCRRNNWVLHLLPQLILLVRQAIDGCCTRLSPDGSFKEHGEAGEDNKTNAPGSMRPELSPLRDEAPRSAL